MTQQKSVPFHGEIRPKIPNQHTNPNAAAAVALEAVVGAPVPEADLDPAIDGQYTVGAVVKVLGIAVQNTTGEIRKRTPELE